MEKRGSYNLRPRKEHPKTHIPKPQIGDRVSIFWEALYKQYEGTLIKFDDVHKTFLVEYDIIPDGFDDDQIWEDLDYVPWRFLDRSEQRKRRCTREFARTHSGLRDDDHCGLLNEGKSLQWFQPGELSSAHSQFCTLSDGSWYRRKRRKKLKDICDNSSGISEESKEEDTALESKEENEEVLDILGGHQFIEETHSRKLHAKSLRGVRNIQLGKKRTYANFGALGFNAVQEDLFAGIGHTNDEFTPPFCFTQDTIRVNCSGNADQHSLARVRSNETRQSNSFFLRTGNHIVYPCETARNANCLGTVEENIRSITRSFGLSGENQYMTSEY